MGTRRCGGRLLVLSSLLIIASAEVFFEERFEGIASMPCLADCSCCSLCSSPASRLLPASPGYVLLFLAPDSSCRIGSGSLLDSVHPFWDEYGRTIDGRALLFVTPPYFCEYCRSVPMSTRLRYCCWSWQTVLPFLLRPSRFWPFGGELN